VKNRNNELIAPQNNELIALQNNELIALQNIELLGPDLQAIEDKNISIQTYVEKNMLRSCKLYLQTRNGE